MECDSCGEHKHKGGAQHFPSAVININSPEKLVMFRKVSLPANLGDEEAFPPAIGKYRNVLLEYESNGHIYLYSSDGIPTQLASASETPEEILARIRALEEADVVMEQEIQGKQDTLTAGTNIQIAGNTISSTDTTYTAGTGLDLTGTQFSVDTSTVATKSDLPTKTSELANDGADGTDTYVESETLSNYQEKLTAGANIQISSNTISATDTTYSAGDGLTLTGTEFDVNSINSQDWSALWQ